MTSSTKTLIINCDSWESIQYAIPFIFPPMFERRLANLARAEREKYVTNSGYNSDPTILESVLPVHKSIVNEVLAWTGNFALFLSNGRQPTGGFQLFSILFQERVKIYNDVNLLIQENPEPFIPQDENFGLKISFDTTCNSPVFTPKIEKSPSEIITGKLFLGGIHSSNPAFFGEFDKMVSVLTELPSFAVPYKEAKSHLHIPLLDNNEADLLPHLDEFVKFVDKAFAEGSKVYVHCHAGISRSASFVTAYLMTKTGMSADDALERLAEKRSIISPNLNFRGLLIVYEKWLKSDKSLSLIEFRDKEFADLKSRY